MSLVTIGSYDAPNPSDLAMGQELQAIIRDNNRNDALDRFLQDEVMFWIRSPFRLSQITAEQYYRYKQDILKKRRTVPDPDSAVSQTVYDPDDPEHVDGSSISTVYGKEIELPFAVNTKLTDNKYAIAVDKKTNYSFALPFAITTDKESLRASDDENLDDIEDPYAELLEDIFDARFRTKLKGTARDAFNGAVAAWIPYYDTDPISNEVVLKFRRVKPYNVLIFWNDEEHTEVDAFIHRYVQIDYTGGVRKEREYMDFYDLEGIIHYEWDGGSLRRRTDVGDGSGVTDHYYVVDNVENDVENPELRGFNWRRVPLITFKSSEAEIPLIDKVKSLQDAYNEIISKFSDVTLEDVYNSVIVLENYDGEDLGEFRRKLAEYGAVKVSSQEGSKGDVRTLELNVSTENYKEILTVLKDAIVENARSLDSKDDRVGNNPNQMNLEAMYAEINLDANDIELEMQASFEVMKYFIDSYALEFHESRTDYTDRRFDVTFQRDIITSDLAIAQTAQTLNGIISNRTIIANIPWVQDVQQELRLLELQRRSELEDAQANMFGPEGPIDPNATAGGDE